jgi:precorrin-4/cobalt-precorrin-4 C11-methyltransferase
MTGSVLFIGAGPGAPDLITLRGAKAIGRADIVIWAASLVHPGILEHARPGAEVVDSSQLPMEGVVPLYERAGLAVEIIPGVSAFTALAAAEHLELTVPEITQSVILTRLEGGKTPMPAGESIRAFAGHGTTMAVFLSAARSGVLQSELLAGGYAEDTPVIIGYQVSWPDELIVWCTVATLAETTKEHKLWKHTLFLVGPGLASHETRSHLYHPGHFHGFRKADHEARIQLKAERGDRPGDEVGVRG